MANVKTAISLDQTLFAKVEETASAMNISRSRLFALAAEEFVRQQHSQQLTQKLNLAYAEGLDEDEQELLRRMRLSHRRLVEGEW